MKKRIKCLLVDDEQYFLNYLKILFELHNFEVLTSPSVDEALDILEKEKVDFIVTDIQMPDKDGFCLIEETQHNKRTKNIPIVVVSNNDSRDVVNKVMHTGVAGFLRKPILKNHIDKIIELLADKDDESSRIVI